MDAQERQELQRLMAKVGATPAQPCDICGMLTSSPYGVCQRTNACTKEQRRRRYLAREAPGAVNRAHHYPAQGKG